MNLTKLALCIALVASTGVHALAMENHADVLRDQYGNAIGGATVTVYQAGSTILATIYADNTALVKPNPFLTDALTGQYNFYATNGSYDLVFSYPGVTFSPDHTARVVLYDPADVTGDGGGGGGGGVTGWPWLGDPDEATWALSEETSLKIGDGTRKLKIWGDATNGVMAKPDPLADSVWRIWPNFNGYIKDEENNSNMVVIDPDAIALGSGTFTFQSNEQLVASNLGVEFSESDTNPTCGAGNYTIYADTSEAKLKKCQNGTVSDLSSSSSGGTTFFSVVKPSDQTLNNSTTLTNDTALLFAMDANSTYLFEGIVTYSSSTVADFQLDFTVPSGASGRRTMNYISSTSSSCFSASLNFNGGTITASATGIGGTGATCDVPIKGYITTTGTAGNFQVLWAQNTGEATDTKVLAGSYLSWRKL